MEQLIEITRVPIEIEMKTSRAQLKHVQASAELEISRDRGGLSIKSRPIQLNMDTFEMRSSIMPTPAQSVQKNAQEGRQAAYTATATYAQEGELYLKAQIGEDVQAQLAKTAISTQMFSQPAMDFIPKEGPEITWDPGEMNIRYEMDKLNINWRMGDGSFEFTPGDIEFTVTQRPDVVIKYLGGPIYVPPSADPNYEPVDVRA